MLTRVPGLTEDQGRVPIENVYTHFASLQSHLQFYRYKNVLTLVPGLIEDQGQMPIENVYAHLLGYNVIHYFIEKIFGLLVFLA